MINRYSDLQVPFFISSKFLFLLLLFTLRPVNHCFNFPSSTSGIYKIFLTYCFTTFQQFVYDLYHIYLLNPSYCFTTFLYFLYDLYVIYLINPAYCFHAILQLFFMIYMMFTFYLFFQVKTKNELFSVDRKHVCRLCATTA